jgi:arylsulfatase A-like enzyme
MARTATAQAGTTWRRPSQRMRRLVAPEAGELVLRPRSLPGLAVALGLATGLLELVTHFLRRQFINPSSFGSLQLNPHAFWMVPIADALIFGACGVALAVMATLFRRRWATATGVFGLVFLAGFVVLLTVRGLSLLACATLAGGVAARVTWRIVSRPQHLTRIIRLGVPALVVLVAGLSSLKYGREMLGEHQLVPAARGAPNVLFVVIDTVRAQSLSLHGYSRQTSPQLEALARRGVRFDHARTAAAWTLPSHASMFTGRWAYELSTHPDCPLDGRFPTLAEFLRDRGYATAGFVGNTYFCNAWFGLNRGFLHYEDVAVSLLEMIRSSSVGRYLAHELVPSTSSRDRVHAYFNRKDAATINRQFLDWLSCRPQGRPFFAFLNYFDAHDPYIAAKGAPRHFGLTPETAQEFSALRDWLHNDKSKLSPRVLQIAHDGYDDGIAYVDDQLGRLLGALERMGLMENTIVVVTADHGELLGEHGSYGHGSHLYREVVNVPLVIAGPRSIPAGQFISELVSLRDLSATVVDLCGLASASPFPGQTLSRFWTRTSSPSAPEDEFLLTETADELSRAPIHFTRARSLTHKGMVYIRNKENREELYDCAADPLESHDLSQTELARPVLARFRAEMKRIDSLAEAARARGTTKTK